MLFINVAEECVILVGLVINGTLPELINYSCKFC